MMASMEVEESVESLPSLEQVKDAVESMTYVERQEYAVKLVKNNMKDPPSLLSFISDLRAAEPAAPVEIEIDEDLTTLLPTQTMNVAKNFHLHQISLVMANTAKFKDVILEEVKSPSRLFKKFAVKHYVRLERNVENLVNVTYAAVPAVQKMLINQLIVQRRVEALDALAEKMQNFPDVVASFLHGCSKDVVRRVVQDERVTKSKSLRGAMLGKNHWDILLDIVEEEIKADYAKHASTRSKVEDFDGWSTTKLLQNFAPCISDRSEQLVEKLGTSKFFVTVAQNTNYCKRLLQLTMKYPKLNSNYCYSNSYETKEQLKLDWNYVKDIWTINDYVLNLPRIPNLIKRCQDEWFEIWKHSYFYHHTAVKVLVKQTKVKDHLDFENVFKLFKPDKQIEALQWILSTWMTKDHIFVPGFQKPAGLLYDPSWRGKKKGKGSNNAIGGVMFCVNKAQTFEQVSAGWISYLDECESHICFDKLLTIDALRDFDHPRQLVVTQMILNYFDSIRPSEGMDELMYFILWARNLEKLCNNWIKALKKKGQALMRKNENLMVNPWIESINLLKAKKDELISLFKTNSWRMEHESRLTELFALHKDVTETLAFWNGILREHPGYRPTPAHELIAQELQSALKTFDTTIQNLQNKHDPLGGKFKPHHNLEYQYSIVASVLGSVNMASGLESTISTMQTIWSEWKAKFVNMDLSLERVVGRQRRRGAIKKQLEGFEKRIKNFVYGEVRATQNYDVIYKDFLYRRFSRADVDTKISMTNQTLGEYLAMMPPALDEDNATKFEKNIHEVRNERWHQLTSALLSGVSRYAMKRNKIVLDTGYDLYKAVLTEVLNAWKTNVPEWCFCKKAGELLTKYVKGYVANRELHSSTEEKVYAPTEKVVQVANDWLELVKSLEPLTDEDVEKRWYEWREWVSPQIQDLAFSILESVVKKQKKLENEKTLEKEKVVLREDLGYLVELGKSLYQECVQMHLTHETKFEESTIKRLEPVCQTAKDFVEKIEHDLDLRNERWMSKLTGAVMKPANLLAKKKWSPNAIKSNQLVEDLEEAWKRLNTRIVKILEEKQKAELKKAGEVVEDDEEEENTKKAVFFHNIVKCEKEIGLEQAKELCEKVGADVQKLSEPFYTCVQLYSLIKEDLEEEEVLIDETPDLPAVSYATAQEIKSLKNCADKALESLTTIFERQRAQKFKSFLDKIGGLKGDEKLVIMCLEDLYFQLHPSYDCSAMKRPYLMTLPDNIVTLLFGDFSSLVTSAHEDVVFQIKPGVIVDAVKRHYLDSLPRYIRQLKKSKDEEVAQFYCRLIRECFFGYYEESFEKDYPHEKLFKRERAEIIRLLYGEITEVKEELVIELFDRVPENSETSLVVKVLKKFAKNTEVFRHCFNYLLEFRRSMGEKFEANVVTFFSLIEDAALKEELFLEISSPKRMCKLLKNHRQLVFDVICCGIPEQGAKEQENESFTPTMRTRVTEIIDALVEDNKNDDQLKDDLNKYVDVTNKKLRRTLVKATDSNAVDIRLQNLKILAEATDITPLEVREVNVHRTLRFFCTKLKNESLEMRSDGILGLFNAFSALTQDVMLKSARCHELVLEMLQDYLEAISLDEDSPVEPWEALFTKLSNRALILGANDLESTIIDFAVELQWRIMKQRLGEKPCAKEFIVNLGELSNRYKRLREREVEKDEEKKEKIDIYFPEENEEGFVAALLKSYETRKKEIYAEHMTTCVDQGMHLEPLFKVLGHNWKDSAFLHEFFANLIGEFQEMKFMVEEEGEDDSLLAPEIEVLTANVLAGVIKLHPNDWYQFSEFNEFVNSVFDAIKELHTRGKDKCLAASQCSILFFLRYTLRWFLDQYNLRLEGENLCEGTSLGEEWKSQPLMKTVVEKCFDILQEDTYPTNGPHMWSLQFEIHLCFRWAITELDKKHSKIELLRQKSATELLPWLKIPIFVQYWDTLVKNMDNVLTNGAPPLRIKDVVNIDGVKYQRLVDDEEKTMFSADEERKVYLTEGVVWALDCLNQYCLGGSHNLEFKYRRMKFLENNSSSSKLLQRPLSFYHPPCAWRWYEIPQFLRLSELSLQLLTNGWEKDNDGLLIVPEKHFVTMFFSRVIYKYHNPNTSAAKNEKPGYVHWSNQVVLKKFADTLMKTRTCVKFVWNIYSHLTADKKGKELWQARDEFVNILLKISPSAIYIPLVWRHLVLHRQDILAKYLDQLTEPHFGLFYIPHAKRPKTKFVAGTQSAGTTKTIHADWGNCIKRIPLELEAAAAFQKELEEWNAEEHGKNEHFDNKEIWSFPPCYQLNRLTPATLEKVYQQKLSEALNKSRPMAERVSAIQRLTLLPYTDLADVTGLVDNAEIDWGTNIKERLVRGTIYVDEITAGAHYVLQPKLLSEQMARVAAFCVDPILNYIPRAAFTRLIQLILSGTRRKKMKVTAYKQMIRLLLRRVTAKHVGIFKREWNRGEVHRDIRVVMIKTALELLKAENPAPYVLKTVWHILESTVSNKDMSHQEELITVVMGASGLITAIDSDVLKKDRLTKHFDELASEVNIADKYWARFVQRVLLPTCSRLHRLARKKRENVYLATPAKDVEESEEAADEKKMEVEDEDDFVLVDDEMVGGDKKPVAEKKKEEVTRHLAVKAETDCYAGEIWKWRGGVRKAGVIYSNWKDTNLIVNMNNEVVIGNRDEECLNNKWIDINGYICTEDEQSYLAMVTDENGVPCGLRLEAVSDDMPLHPDVSFRSDGQIMFKQHEHYERSEDDLPFLALQLMDKYLENKKQDGIEEDLRARVARLCFEIITDTSLEFVNHPQAKYTETMRSRFELACRVLSNTIKACPQKMFGTQGTKDIYDERWVQFFERAMDILFTQLGETEDSEIKTGLSKLMTTIWSTTKTTFGSEKYMLQLIRGYFEMNYLVANEIFWEWVGRQADKVFNLNQLLTANNPSEEEMASVIDPVFNFIAWQIEQICTTYDRRNDIFMFNLTAFGYQTTTNHELWQRLIRKVLTAFINDELPTSQEIRELPAYKKVLAEGTCTAINKFSNSIGIKFTADWVDLYWKFLTEMAVPFMMNGGKPQDKVLRICVWDQNYHNRAKTTPEGSNELQKRVWQKLFELFPGKIPKSKDRTDEQSAWMQIYDANFGGLSSNPMWWHINQDYILPILSLTLRGKQDRKFHTLVDTLRGIVSDHAYQRKRRTEIYYRYEEGDTMLNFKQLLIADILDKRNADVYNFDIVYDLFVQKKKGYTLLNCPFFSEVLQDFVDLFYAFDLKRDPEKRKPQASFVTQLIITLSQASHYESWPQLESVISTYISRGSENDATLYDREIAKILIGRYPTMVWNQNNNNFSSISEFMLVTACKQLEEDERKRKEQEAKQSMLEEARKLERLRDTFTFPSVVERACSTVLSCVEVPLGDRQVKTLPESGQSIIRSLTDRMLSIMITNWKDTSFADLVAVFPGLYILLNKTNLFMQVYREDTEKLLQVFEHVMNLYVQHPFGFTGFTNGASSLVDFLVTLVNHTKHCDSYEPCYVPLMQLIVNKVLEENESGNSMGTNYTSLWFHICSTKPLLVIEHLHETSDILPQVYDCMYTVAKTLYHDKEAPASAKQKYAKALLRLPSVILKERFPNFVKTKTIGELTPVMMHTLVDRATEDFDKFACYLLDDTNMFESYLHDIVLVLSVGADKAGDFIIHLANQIDLEFTYNHNLITYIFRGLLWAFRERERVDGMSNIPEEQEEHTVVIHQDTVAQYVKVANYIENNNERKKVVAPLMAALKAAILVNRTFAGNQDRLWLNQQEALWFRIIQFSFADWNTKFKLNLSSLSTEVVNILKQQILYDIGGYIDTMNDLAKVVEIVLRYLQYITSWDSNNAHNLQMIKQMRYELIKHIGFISAGCGDTTESEVLKMGELVEEETYGVSMNEADLKESGLDMEVALQLKGKDVMLVSMQEETVTVSFEEQEISNVPVSILREQADGKKAGKVKYVWFDEFVQLLRPLQTDSNPDIRFKALTTLTTYRSKSAWEEVSYEVSSRVRVNDPKIRKKQKQKSRKTSFGHI